MVYIIVSNSFHILNEEINKIFKKMDDVEIIDYQNTTLDEIINICSYSSLFSDEKNIIVKNCNFLNTKNNDKTDILEKYIENPNPLTNIIFTFNDKVDERKKVVKLIKDQGNYIYIKPLNYKDINSRLIETAKKNKYKLNSNDASYITMSSLNNYDIASNELEKVFLYYNEPCEIKRDDLENIISHSLDDNNFKFVDAVIQRNFKEAMKLIKNFKLFKIEPISLVYLLSREYRLMMLTKNMLENGYSNIKIAKELSLQDWQLEKIINNSYNYSNMELEDKIIDLCELDYKLKTSFMDKYLGLEMFVLKG